MHNLTAKQLHENIINARTTSTEATRTILDRIEKLDKNIGAYITIFADQALARAAAIDKRVAAGQPTGPLAGVPVAVKDNMCTDFGTTTCASKILQNFKSPYNATVIDKLLAADAVIIGKLNMDEFAMGSSTENSGLKQTVNPWDPTRVPGGSSGGSAAAVAADLCFAALGSDTGGSIRQPAGFCGVTGLKPTYGRVSRFGLVAYGSSLDQIGPVTKDVTDAALILNAIAGHDSADSTSVKEQIAPTQNYLENIDQDIDSLKIGVVEKLNDSADPQVAAAVRKAIQSYADNGAEIVNLEMPHFEYAISAYYVIATAEASSNLARYDGVHFGHRTKNPADYIEVYSKSRAEGFGPEVKRRIMLGTYALSSGYYDAYYLKALKVRNLIRRDFDNAFKNCHCLMMPVSPTTAFKIGEKTGDPLQMYLADLYTIPANLAGIAGISIPCGFDDQNLPIALQIMSPPFTEPQLLRIARMYEKTRDWINRKPQLSTE